MLEKCDFFKHYKTNAEVVKLGWIRMYCESHEKSENCKRKQILKETGENPKENLSPTGQLLL